MGINKVREGLGLLNSMVCSGEIHTQISIDAKNKAYFALTELERLANIGTATEKAFKEGYPDFSLWVESERSNRLIESIEELLEWAKGE